MTTHGIITEDVRETFSKPVPDSGLAAKAPIFVVLFIHESGYVESWKPDEIRANPGAFKAALEEHRAAGRKPLAMRGKQRAAA